MREENSIYIFDTNIFLTGIDFNVIEGSIYTTPSIIEEVKAIRYKEKNRNIINKINAAIETRKLIIENPKKEFLRKISEISKKTGDFNALSDTDKGLVALTLELKEKKSVPLKIYSNDYSIENLCSELEIPFSPLYKNGIEIKIIWEIFCPYCNKVYTTEELNKICDICGSKLKRRPKNNI